MNRSLPEPLLQERRAIRTLTLPGLIRLVTEIDDNGPISHRRGSLQGAFGDRVGPSATGGDDYALLAALPPAVEPVSLSLPEQPTLACIGRLVAKRGLRLRDRDGDVPLPERLGYEHRSSQMGGRL